MDWQKICSLADIPQDAGTCALVNDRQIALFKVDEAVYALSNFDPFSRANVLSRGIIGDCENQLYVASPIYKQRFCLQSGQCLDDKDINIANFPTRISNGDVEVRVA